MRKLKPQYEEFCRSYSDGANAFGAAVAAGYSRKSAYVTGSRLLTRPEIVARIQELRHLLAERESLHAPALLAKLETAYAQASAAKNPLAIVRVVELQAKIAGLVGARALAPPSNPGEGDEIEREIAALVGDALPPKESPRERKPSRPARKAAPSPATPVVSVPAVRELGAHGSVVPGPVAPQPVAPLAVGKGEPVVLPTVGPIVGHDEPPAITEVAAAPASPDAGTDDAATQDEEVRRQHIRRLALEAVSRARTRRRLHRSA
jgi:hypothetical protein